MRTCSYCKIQVGSDTDKCPLCQSRLMGSVEGEMYFPTREALEFRSFLYKLQMFIVWSLIIAGLGLDFLFHIKIPPFENIHWSLIIAMWLLVFEFVIIRQFRPGTGSARKVTIMVAVILTMLLITAHFLGFMWLAWDWIVPITVTAAMIADFVLVLLDRQGNAMAYLLTGLVFVLVPCTIQVLRQVEMPMTWIICMLAGAMLIAGTVIFKGRAVADEIRRRFTV